LLWVALAGLIAWLTCTLQPFLGRYGKRQRQHATLRSQFIMPVRRLCFWLQAECMGLKCGTKTDQSMVSTQ